MNPEDDNCPFKLSNLTFGHCSDFITQRKACKRKHRSEGMSLGNASYEQLQSALKHLFHMSKYDMQLDFFDNLKQFTKGIWWHIANKKVQEWDVTIVGKKKMGFNVYKKNCELVMKEEGREFIFACAFLTLKSGISWRDLKMLCKRIFCTGWNRNQEWHVYANPHNPEICPVHALACNIFSNPGAFSAIMDEIVNKH